MRVVVGLSGGVDSSVAAYLLQQQGHEVIGLFMKNWHDDSVTISDECPWMDDSQDALMVAEKLGIPFQTVDLSAQYKERIVDYMFDQYERGFTPNPDVLCNREIKFDLFLKIAMELGADKVATGHYCRVAQDDNGFRLLQGKDPKKDQSYFLCQLSQEQLSKAMFPVGELEKSQVREIAKEADLITADKKDSQGLCFIGKVRLPEFLQQKLAPKEGEVVEVPSSFFDDKQNVDQSLPYHFDPALGKVVGKHQGAHYFTIGQRKGLGVSGLELPAFVIGIDTDRNLVYVGQGDDHPGLYRKSLRVAEKDIHWVRPEQALETGQEKELLVRIRYRQAKQEATLRKESDHLLITFKEPQRGITSGQFAAWHMEDELLGSGVIL